MASECEGDSCKLPIRPITQEQTSNKEQSAWNQFFFDGLEDSEGKPVDPSILNGKYVGLYFSAAWCPPCRAFSPILAEFQKKHAKDIQIVFASLDNTVEQMHDYMRGKPWPAIRRHQNGPSAVDFLGDKYKVSMIPTLVILDPQGNFVTDWGRSAVSKNPSGCLDQWKQGFRGFYWWQLLKFW